MKDLNRITEILTKLERIWRDNPDYRLGQLIVIASQTNKACPEVFYVEDDKILEGMLNFENKLNSK